ncbi:MAG: hypothetical protein R3Y19_07050 [Rikenellaceae bacterium]
MKKLFLLVVLTPLLGFTTTMAQSTIRTPFEKLEYAPGGKAIYKWSNNDKFSKLSISTFYGWNSMMAQDWFNSPTFNTKYSALTTYPSVANSTSGAIGLGLNIMATPWLEVSIPFVWMCNTGKLQDLPSEVRNNDYNETWFCMLPNVKVSWIFNDWFHLYSRVGFGWGLGNRLERNKSMNEYNAGIQLNHQFAFAWQVSPIGVEFGRRVVFFAEYGFGTTGTVTAGLKVRFNKIKQQKAADWQDSYIH